MSLLYDWSFWGTIAGIVATVVFGVWAVVLAKSRKYPGEITFFHERTIRLLDDVVGDLPQITVNYKGQPAAKNLTLLKGFLLNTGRKDLSKEMIEQPLSIQLPEGYRWLEASAKGSWDGVEHAAIIEPRTVAISWTLLRCSEFMTFESLVEVAELKNWRPHLVTQHRIADTGRVRVHRVPTKLKNDWKELAIPVLLAMVVSEVVGYVFSMRGHFPSARVLIMFSLGVISGVATALTLFLVLARKMQRIRNLLKLDNKE
jgi:hypothetical protein